MEGNYVPNDINTEKAILGLVILHNDLANKLIERITSNDFYDLRNETIFRAIKNLNIENKPIDLTTLKDKLESMGSLDEVGGEEYIATLVGGNYYKSNFDAYIDIVKEKSMLRSLLTVGDELINKVKSTSSTSEELIGQFSEKLFNLSNYSDKEGLTRLNLMVEDTLGHIFEMSQNQGDLTGVTTGFRDLDRQLSGLQNSDMVLLAARPSMGKTALGVHMALNAALAGKKVAVFSLEMSKRQLLFRILSVLTNVDLKDIISGQIAEKDWELIYNSANTINDLDMYIDDTASISLTELRAKAKRLKVESGIDLILIDYLQLMTVDTGKVENRQQEISSISRGLKALAKELNVPILALSQLSRKSEERTNKRPMMSDLRESGAIEQDADVVMMLYRDDYYEDADEVERPNLIEVIIAKHRNGPTGTVELFFKKENTKFYDLDYSDNVNN